MLSGAAPGQGGIRRGSAALCCWRALGPLTLPHHIGAICLNGLPPTKCDFTGSKLFALV